MHKVVVAVGSTNPVKIAAVRNVLSRIYDYVEVVGVKVSSGVSDQPLSIDETIIGAINRAKRARDKIDADLGVGIEAGLVRTPHTLSGYIDVQYCAIVDRRGLITLGHGPGFEYPPCVVKRILAEGRTAGDVFEELTGIREIGRKIGAIGYLSGGLMDRTKLSEIAVLMAMIPRLYRELYGI